LLVGLTVAGAVAAAADDAAEDGEEDEAADAAGDAEDEGAVLLEPAGEGLAFALALVLRSVRISP
jgi:hypothetical protein